jgi:hypothetical protein
LFAEAMPWGVSSLLVQVTVVPAFTVKVCGVKVKLWIATALEEVCALATRTPPARPEPTIAPKTAAAITDRIIIFLSLARSGIVDHERPFCWLEPTPMRLLRRRPSNEVVYSRRLPAPKARRIVGNQNEFASW